MNTNERIGRMFRHEDADRVPITDSPWASTIERWHREGMPAGVDWREYFDVDRVEQIAVDTSPRYPRKVIEQTDEYEIARNRWGVTLKQWTHAESTPEFMDHTVVDRDSWLKAKARMTPANDRVNWDKLKADYPRWREQGRWIVGRFWFGFDVTHSWMVGTERLLMALIDDPEWCVDMFNTFLDMDIAMFETIWQAGYTFDAIRWPDDLGYKGKQFMSPGMYRQLLKPVQKRALDWAHSKGIYACLHSCGDIRPFIPEWVEIGIDSINPLEVKAGVDPIETKAGYGDQLVLHGGINAVLWDKPEAVEAEMRRVVPAMKAGGGYILSSDHSIPSSVSLDDMRRIVALAKQLGSYE